MKVSGENTYRLQSSNKHLLNILDENYYLELGVVDLSLLTRLMSGAVLNLSDFIYSDITVEGIGKITNDSPAELTYQLTYLLQIRQRSSSYKLFLTCGVLKYHNEEEQETFAPILLIPVEIDPNSEKFVKSSSVIINHLLLKKLFREDTELYRRYLNEKITSVAQIDLYCDDLAKRTNTTVSVENYLTYAQVEYKDFFVARNFFEVERSIFDNRVSHLYREYYKNVKAILPTNIYQKHVILKAVRGSNVAIDGRLGAGKTYTIINIIADRLAKGKRVLYVNQDIDNIWDLQRNFQLLGLSGFLFNFVKMLEPIEVPDVELPELTYRLDYLDVMNRIEAYEASLDEKIHGYPYRYILEQLAIINNTYPGLEPIEIEVDLERFEVEKIYQTLKEVEKAFQTITPYHQNVWRKIESFYTKDHIPEIMAVTKYFSEVQKEMYQYIQTFCHQYGLKIPENIRSVHRLILTLRNFMITPPPAYWSDSFRFDDAHQAIIAISVWQEKHFELSNYYNTNISPSYAIGSATKLLAQLYQNHLTPHDAIYIDRMLSQNAPLSQIVQNNAMHQRIIMQLVKEIKKIFNVNELSNQIYSLLAKLNTFYLKNKPIPLWIKRYLEDDQNFEKKIRVLYRKIRKLQDEISSKFVHSNDFQFSYISSIIDHKRFRHYLRRIVKREVIRQGLLDELIKEIKQYLGRSNQLNELVGYQADMGPNPELVWQQCINWFDLCHSLSEKESQLFKTLLQSNLMEEQEQNVISIIHKFASEITYFEDSFDQLKTYRIIISDDNILNQIDEYQEWEKYLKTVIDVKTKVRSIFQKKEDITYRDLVELRMKDEEIKALEESDRERKPIYQKLLGQHYRGIDTDCVTISKLIDHFDSFIERLEDLNSLESLLKPKTMEKMTSEYFLMDALYEKWITRYRNFSRYFHGGEPVFYDVSLQEGIDIIDNYVKSIDQLETMMHMIQYHKFYFEQGLFDLADGIRTSRYVNNISVRYLYSTFLRLRKKFEIMHTDLISGAEVLTHLEKHVNFECDYCTENIIELQKEASTAERRAKYRLDSIPFHHYNRIFEMVERHKLLFLADVSIFNSDLDLSVFDLVVIDDGHLSSANKYHRLDECRQVIVFGDSSFRSSISNTLIKRIDKAAIIPLPYRYIKSCSCFGDFLSIKNQYIYEFEPKVDITGYNSLSDWAIRLVNFFYKHDTHTINIIIGDPQTRRLIFSELVTKLKRYYDDQQIVHILNVNIHILNVTNEGTRYANDVIIYYHDFENFDPSNQELILKNFTSAKDRVLFFYIVPKNSEEETLIQSRIKLLMHDHKYSLKDLNGIGAILLQKLKAKKLKAEPGFGQFDIIIRTQTPVGIMILERDQNSYFSLLDDYKYYYQQFMKNGWFVKIFFVSQLMNDLDGKVDQLIEEINNDLYQKEIVIKENF